MQALQLESVNKRLGSIQVLRDIAFEVPEGSAVALLGPNGAGKSTLVRIAATLSSPDSGRVSVFGLDTARSADQIHSLIGLVGQSTSLDMKLTAMENLQLFARLNHAPKSERRDRIAGLIETLGLKDICQRPVRTYSGGEIRKADLAASLVGKPRLLFLDEPTTGLDPTSRSDLWNLIEDLVADGASILLTTQYLDEAERLADSVAILNKGAIIAHESATALKARIGATVLTAQPTLAEDLSRLLEIFRAAGCDKAHPEGGSIKAAVPNGLQELLAISEAAYRADLPIQDLHLSQPSLEEAFMVLTGDKVA